MSEAGGRRHELRLKMDGWMEVSKVQCDANEEVDMGDNIVMYKSY